MDVWALAGAGATAGVVAKTATAPLERVKMLLQVQAMATRAAAEQLAVAGGAQLAVPATVRPQQYRGIWGTLTRVLRTEGGRALFQGNGALPPPRSLPASQPSASFSDFL